MKDDNIKRFFDDHKQAVEDGGFSERIFATLDCLPEPKPKRDRAKLTMLIFTIAGILLFVIAGGYTEILKALATFGNLFTDVNMITPEIVVALVFTACSIFAVGRFAVKEL